MNLELEKEYSKAPIIAEVDALKKQIDDVRPLPPDVEGKVMQKLRLDWNYNSNAIEGNKLSYGETTALLMHGVTAKGKPLKDHLDIQGHNEGIDFIIDIVKDSRPLTQADIRSLHSLILGEPTIISAETSDGSPTTKKLLIGEYKKLPNHVKTRTGEIHYYATPEEVTAKMEELMNWYYEASNDKGISSLVVASLFHHRFVEIHPFDDGNGRMSRILMNLILLRSGYPIAVIRTDDKDNYYSLLSQADVGDAWPFVEYIIERVNASVKIYLKAINGGDIDEDEDIDKAIALVQMELKGNATANIIKTDEIVKMIFEKQLLPFAWKIAEKFKPLEENFNSTKREVLFGYLIEDPISDAIKTLYESAELLQNQEYSNFFLQRSYSEIIFQFNYRNYKNPIKTFDVFCYFKVNLRKFAYDFIIDKVIFSKLYDEALSKKDLSLVAEAFVQKFKTSNT